MGLRIWCDKVSAPGWDLAGRPYRGFVAVLMGLCLVLGVAKIFWIGWFGLNRFNDFFGLWSFAKFEMMQAPAGIYDQGRLQAAQIALGPGFGGFYPCPYPPSFLAAIGWLGWFGETLARLLWTGAGLVLLALSCWRLFTPAFRWAGVAFVLVAPASLMNGLSGETGFFTTALLVAGLAWLPERPVLAGAAFGLLTLKPQLGVLVPFLLLARWDWRAIAAACCTGLGLIGLSCLVLPAGMWGAWLRELPRYESLVAANHQLIAGMATIDAGLLQFGVAAHWALVGQVAVSVVIAGLIMRCVRILDDRLAAACVLAGSCLAAPHAFVYDAVGESVALVLCVEWMAERGLRLPTWGLCLGVVAYLSPLWVSGGPGLLAYAIPEIAVFVGIVWMGLKRSAP